MEYHLTKKSVPEPMILLDSVSEQPVDVDLTLPDYCPDIERILRCTLIPKIYQSNVSGDRLAVEGGACVRILYLDSDRGGVRSFEYTAPFSDSFALRDSPDDCAVYVDTKPEYLNCRAMSPRKLSLHGAFSLYAKVIVPGELSYCVHEDDDDLQVSSSETSVSALCGLCRETFGMQEDIPMSGRPEIAAFITHRLSVRITELKAIRDKIMLSAEGRLELMYLSDPDGGDPECMTCAFPISRIIDCPGADEDCVIDPRLDVMTYDLSLNDDALDGSGVLTLDMKLCFNALCRRDEDISVIGDVFSTDREVQTRCEPMTCRGRTRCLRFTDVAKATLTVDGESIAKVIDVQAGRIVVSAAVSGGAPLLSSRMTVSMMFIASDGGVKSIDRDIEFDYNPSVDDCDSVDSVTAAVDNLSYRIVDERTVEIRAEVCYRMTVSAVNSLCAVTSVTADDDAPQKCCDGALILCYADRGDRVWDIAKRYSTRPADIIAENSLDCDVLPADMMLMIYSGQ